MTVSTHRMSGCCSHVANNILTDSGGGSPKALEDWRRDTLRMFSLGHHKGLQLRDAINPDHLAPILNEVITKSATDRADVFLEKAGPLLTPFRGKKKTVAKENLTDIFKAATIMMLQLHTQRSELQCGADTAKWLETGHQPNTTQYTLHTLHAAAIKKDAHFPDDRAIALVCCPAISLRGDKNGEHRGLVTRDFQSAIVILDCS